MVVTKEIALEIIDEMLSGEMIKGILDKRGINPRYFYEFLNSDPETDKIYARARIAKSEFMVEEIPHIADTEDDAQKARNMIDARKWYASKMQPAKYGERIDLNVTQTIGIGSLIAEARARALPSCYPVKDVESEVIDTPKQIETKIEGIQPTIPDSEDAPTISVEDILK